MFHKILFLSLFSIIKTQIIRPIINENTSKIFCGSKNLKFYDHTPYRYLTKEISLCFGEIFLLNYVQSSSWHFHRRQTIRQTWGSLKFINENPVRLLFIVGRPVDNGIQTQLEEEIQEYRDIVQVDFLDSYYNLTLKHIVALHWIHNYCSHAKFISKTDDDTFVSIFHLVEYLKSNFNSENAFILGNIFQSDAPIRDKKSKWFMPKNLYPPNRFPPHMKGAGYVISQHAIKPLLICSYFHKYIFIDDVFISGIVSKMANIKLVQNNWLFGNKMIQSNKITFDMIDNLYSINQYRFNQLIWINLWNHILNMEL